MWLRHNAVRDGDPRRYTCSPPVERGLWRQHWDPGYGHLFESGDSALSLSSVHVRHQSDDHRVSLSWSRWWLVIAWSIGFSLSFSVVDSDGALRYWSYLLCDIRELLQS